MTAEELKIIKFILSNFLTYDVCEDLMWTDEVKKALEAVDRELNEKKDEE